MFKKESMKQVGKDIMSMYMTMCISWGKITATFNDPGKVHKTLWLYICMNTAKYLFYSFLLKELVRKSGLTRIGYRFKKAIRFTSCVWLTHWTCRTWPHPQRDIFANECLLYLCQSNISQWKLFKVGLYSYYLSWQQHLRITDKADQQQQHKAG